MIDRTMSMAEIFVQAEKTARELLESVDHLIEEVTVPMEIREVVGVVVSLGCTQMEDREYSKSFNSDMARLAQLIYLVGYKHALDSIKEQSNASTARA